MTHYKGMCVFSVISGYLLFGRMLAQRSYHFAGGNRLFFKREGASGDWAEILCDLVQC
jgi:hypothetical protein